MSPNPQGSCSPTVGLGVFKWGWGCRAGGPVPCQPRVSSLQAEGVILKNEPPFPAETPPFSWKRFNKVNKAPAPSKNKPSARRRREGSGASVTRHGHGTGTGTGTGSDTGHPAPGTGLTPRSDTGPTAPLLHPAPRSSGRAGKCRLHLPWGC